VTDASFRPLAVLFDLDGTLLDTFPAVTRAWNAAMEPILGRAFDPIEVAAHFGPPDEPMLLAAFPDSLSASEREAAIERYFAEYCLALAQIKPFEGIESLLDWLGARALPMGIVTGKGRRATDVTLAHFGWTDRFEWVVTGSEVALPKPDPEGVRRVARELHMEAANCVFIGDSPADIGAAQNAGMLSVVAGWHDFYLEELRHLSPDFWPQSPFELQRWFEAHLQ
jgi:HAD superfamily hydrolase (TIGR01509 family)